MANKGDDGCLGGRWVAKKGDGCLGGRWVAKKGDGCLGGRWVAKQRVVWLSKEMVTK